MFIISDRVTGKYFYVQHFCIVWITGNEPVFKNKKVLLLEAAAQRKQHQLPESFSSRVCALSRGTVQLLESMSVCHVVVSRVKLCQMCRSLLMELMKITALVPSML